MNPNKILLVLLLLSWLLPIHALQLPALFSDNMVLQRGRCNPIWGKATPYSTITVKVDGKTIHTKAAKDSTWKSFLPELKLQKQYSIIVHNQNESIQIENVIAGDVYYAGGQSNMQFTLPNSIGGQDAVKQANNEDIRFFIVPRAVAYHARFDIDKSNSESIYDARWVMTDSLSSKMFSAVAYYFARKLFSDTQIPVAIIQACWGGTPIEAHSSKEVNAQFPEFCESLKIADRKNPNDGLYINKKKETPQFPSSIYNAMIHPLIPYRISGFLWYQGEHNWNYPLRYKKQLTAMINDFRAKWKIHNLPFYIVQLPGIGKPDSVYKAYNWAVLRESQQQAAIATNSKLCITIDLGGDGDLHPKNKLEVGERLAYLVNGNAQHRKMDIFPVFKSYKISKLGIILTFNQELVSKSADSSATGFIICGKDGQFFPAIAQINGNRVIVSSSQVLNPTAVRYAWGGNPKTGYYNKAGLPLTPFRTDKFRVTADGKW